MRHNSLLNLIIFVREKYSILSISIEEKVLERPVKKVSDQWNLKKTTKLTKLDGKNDKLKVTTELRNILRKNLYEEKKVFKCYFI